MSIATFRSLGRSVILTIPKPILELAHLHVGLQVNIDVQNHHLIVSPKKKPHYTLAELVSKCDFSRPISDEEKEWLDMPNVGEEEL